MFSTIIFLLGIIVFVGLLIGLIVVAKMSSLEGEPPHLPAFLIPITFFICAIAARYLFGW